MQKNNKLPKHIAIIPDGNRRWAKEHKTEAWFGHRKGAERKKIEKLINVIVELNIPYLSFWGSSRDNLKKRSKTEIASLLSIFKDKFLELADDEYIHQNKMKINIIGDWKNQFPDEVCLSMEKAIERTKEYNKFFLNFFIAYSGKGEILDAIKCITRKARNDETLAIDEDLLKSCLLTKGLPPVDLMIRSGGEPHLSDGFMMWETANSQLYFLEKYWPEFNENDFRIAIDDYLNRHRRYGK